MFLPIGDEPNLRGTPYVTWGLIALNTAIYVLVTLPLSAQGVSPDNPALLTYLDAISRETGVAPYMLAQRATAYDLFTYQYGFRPAEPSLVALFSSMFLHGGFMHLAGNMLFLWIYGDNVELHFGRVRFAMMYLGTGVLATVFFAVFQGNSQIPLVGASGAISGVLGCYFVWFPRNVVRVMMFIFFFVHLVRIPARWVLGFYLVFDNVFPFLANRGGGVAHGAHIGGFLGGLGVAWGFAQWSQRRELSRPLRSSAAAEGTHDRSWASSASSEFDRAVAHEEGFHALQLYADMTPRERGALSPDSLFELVEQLADQGHANAGLAVLQRFIGTQHRSDRLGEAHLLAGHLHLRHLGRLPAANQHFLAVLDLDPVPELARAAREGLAAVREGSGPGRFH